MVFSIDRSKTPEENREYYRHFDSWITPKQPQYRIGKVSIDISADYNEKVKNSDCEASNPTWLNIGYFCLQFIMSGLHLKDFFKKFFNKGFKYF